MKYDKKGVRFFTIHLVLLLAMAFLAPLAFAEVPIVFIHDAQWGIQQQPDSREEARLRDIISQEFSLNDDLYLEARVKIISDDKGNPDALLVYLLDAVTYSFTTSRVDLADDLSIVSIEPDYDELLPDMEQEDSATWASCPDPGIQMVFSTMETKLPTAVAAVDRAAQIARNKGYKVKVLKGPQENISAVKNWLSCENLVLYGRVGHGNNDGIMVDDGVVGYRDFRAMSSTALNGKMLYFNSCKVHNDPLKSAIVGAGVQKFIGGITNLAIGPSENVFKCWMNKVVAEEKGMTPSLASCQEQYPDAGVHGISGNGSDFIHPDGPQPPPSADNELKNGETRKNLSGSAGDWLYFKVNVPANASNLKITISGGTGDADLYTRFGSRPTDTDYDCRPWLDGNQETCGPIANPAKGSYSIGINGYSSFSGVSLTVQYETDDNHDQPATDKNELKNGEVRGNLHAAQGEWLYFKIKVPEGAEDLRIAISGGSGDADLYTRYGARPTDKEFDCRPWLDGNNETCPRISNPKKGYYYIGLKGYRGFSGVRLSAGYNTYGENGEIGVACPPFQFIE